MEYPFIAIVPSFIPTRVVVAKKVLSMCQIYLFEI